MLVLKTHLDMKEAMLLIVNDHLTEFDQDSDIDELFSRIASECREKLHYDRESSKNNSLPLPDVQYINEIYL